MTSIGTAAWLSSLHISDLISLPAQIIEEIITGLFTDFSVVVFSSEALQNVQDQAEGDSGKLEDHIREQQQYDHSIPQAKRLRETRTQHGQ